MPNEKFKALVHYVIHQCRDEPGRLGAVRLNKVLWYSDTLSYKAFGVPISGERYVKRQMGPVPSSILATLRQLASEGSILINEPEHEYDPRKYIALTLPPKNVLSSGELDIADNVLSAICGFSANKVSEITHDQIWDAAQMGEVIPYEATLAVEEGEVTSNVLAWADQIIEAQTEVFA